MEPKINKTSKYIEIIGHYDNPILCAKMTLLADLYAIEHRYGYAKFRIEDEDKLGLVNEKLDYVGQLHIYSNNGQTLLTTLDYGPLTCTITSTGTSEDGMGQSYTYSGSQTFLGFSITANATVPDSDLEVGDTFSIQSNRTVYIVEGPSSPTVTDLTGTKWVFNDEINVSDGNSFAINFISNNTNYTYIKTGGTGGGYLRYCVDDISVQIVYDSGQEPPFVAGWTDDAYKTIAITGGTDATNANLISWLQANATQIQSGPTYVLSATTDNCEITNVSFILVPNSGYQLPSSISVTNATLVSYNSTSGEVVLSGVSNDTSVDVDFSALPPYLTFSSPNTFTLKVTDQLKYWDGTLQYSTNATNWSTWDGTTILSSTQSGTTKYLYVRGSNNTYITGSSASSTKGKWVLTGSSISCNGNIETLLDYQTVANGSHPTMASYCYAYMFQNCSSLTTAPELPATTLADYCYYDMFENCSSLTTAPELPATTLTNRCYAHMFQNCYSLTTAPELPATTLADYCYAYMFYSCKVLTTAPELPATTLADYCYYDMFENCYSLTTAPELPATTLTNRCYNYMFYNCKALVNVPELPATTLASHCYYDMFYNCTSLTTAPNLPATTLASYCYNGMFYNCTSLTTAPNLPATTLASYCYQTMFYGCTSLTVPAIMAGGTTQATAAKNCCNQMYYGCSALKIYTSSSGHTPCYKAITYSTTSGDTNHQSSYQMFYNCKINGSTSTTDYLTAGTQYYY